MSHPQSPSISLGQTVAGASAKVVIDLQAPTARLAVRDPRPLGRAQAAFAGKSWAAKHYWAEGTEGERVTTYEFDEALPAGTVELTIPVG